jgi:hypothetical protein
VVLLTDKIENLIKKMKQQQPLDKVCFVKAYNGRLRETPLGELLVTVGVGKNTQDSFYGGYMGNGEKGENITGELLLNVYCPYSSGGDGITDVVNNILESLNNNDDENLVTSISVSEIKFSKEYEAVYRTVTISLNYCL